MRDLLMLHGLRNSGRDFWWNQLPCWPVLTPISCTKLKIHSVMRTVLFLKQVLIFHLFCGTKSMLRRSRNSGRDFWWNQPPWPCGPVLTLISCTKLKIHSALADSLIVPEQVNLALVIWMRDQSMLHRSRNCGRVFGGTDHIHICVTLQSFIKLSWIDG